MAGKGEQLNEAELPQAEGREEIRTAHGGVSMWRNWSFVSSDRNRKWYSRSGNLMALEKVRHRITMSWQFFKMRLREELRCLHLCKAMTASFTVTSQKGPKCHELTNR